MIEQGEYGRAGGAADGVLRWLARLRPGCAGASSAMRAARLWGAVYKSNTAPSAATWKCGGSDFASRLVGSTSGFVWFKCVK